MVSRSVYERYFRVSIAISVSDTFGYLLVVFELPKSGNIEVSFSGASEYPQPVIHYIGIYSKRKMD